MSSTPGLATSQANIDLDVTGKKRRANKQCLVMLNKKKGKNHEEYKSAVLTLPKRCTDLISGSDIGPIMTQKVRSGIGNKRLI